MKKSGLFIGIFILLYLTCSIVYAATQTSLRATGTTIVRVQSDLRITALKVLEIGEEAKSKTIGYTEDTTNMEVYFPNKESTITYEVTITNRTQNSFSISNIEITNSNPNVSYTLEDINENELYDRDKLKFRVVLKTNDSKQKANISIKYGLNKTLE